MIYVECYADRALVRELTGFSKKAISHSGTKSKVIKQLMKAKNSTGLIEEDPWSLQPKELQQMKIEAELEGLKILATQKNANFLIIICPRLEEWIIKSAKSARLKLEDYGLPTKANKLHEAINSNLKQFENLIRDLKKNKSLKTLRKFLLKEG